MRASRSGRLPRKDLRKPILHGKNTWPYEDKGTGIPSSEKSVERLSRPTPSAYRPDPPVETTRKFLYRLSYWNCGGRHRYVDCHLPRMGQFCYECGERQVILRDCHRCASSYHRTRVYTAFRGSRDVGVPPQMETEGWARRSDCKGSSSSSA